MRNKTKGMTLIEVLIALAILSIAMTAIIKATGQNIRDTSYLIDKASANWMALTIINQARLGLLAVRPGDQLDDHTELLGKTWYWQLTATISKNTRIQTLDVKVMRTLKDSALVSMQSYRYAP